MNDYMPVRVAHAPSELENFVHFSVVEDLTRAEHVDSGNGHIFFIRLVVEFVA